MKLLFYFDGDDDHKIDYMDIYRPCTGRDTWYTKEVATHEGKGPQATMKVNKQWVSLSVGENKLIQPPKSRRRDLERKVPFAFRKWCLVGPKSMKNDSAPYSHEKNIKKRETDLDSEIN